MWLSVVVTFAASLVAPSAPLARSQLRFRPLLAARSSRMMTSRDDRISAYRQLKRRRASESRVDDKIWPVGDPEANPTARRPTASQAWFSGLLGDVALRRPTYLADWAAGLQPKVLPKMFGATLFLYFACLAPVVAFGGAMQLATGGQIGITETILSRGVCGMLYATFAGQPMTFIGPTGLTLAFTTALYAWTAPRGIPFLPMYAWVGVWTSGFVVLAAVTNAANLIRFCTRFTEDVFK